MVVKCPPLPPPPPVPPDPLQPVIIDVKKTIRKKKCPILSNTNNTVDPPPTTPSIAMKEGGGGDTKYEEKLKEMVLIHKNEVNKIRMACEEEIQSKTSNTQRKGKNEVDEYIFLGLTMLTIFFILYIFMNLSTLILTCIFIIIVTSALLWTEAVTVTTMWGAVSQFSVLMINSFKAVKCVWVDSPPPTSCKNIKLAKTDHYYDETVPVIKYRPNVELKQTHYNFKLAIVANRIDDTVAELDSDSHISLVSEEYFLKLKNRGHIEFLDEDPVVFEGLGSRIKSKYPPFMMYVQIGRVELQGRFVVTEHLESSPVLLGTDFCINNSVSVGPYQNKTWYVHVGPIDAPLGKIEAIVSNKITLSNTNHESFLPFETKKIKVACQLSDFESGFARNHEFSEKIVPNRDLNRSPFLIRDDLKPSDSCIFVQNLSPLYCSLPSGMNLADTELDLKCLHIESTLKKTVHEIQADEGGNQFCL